MRRYTTPQVVLGCFAFLALIGINFSAKVLAQGSNADSGPAVSSAASDDTSRTPSKEERDAEARIEFRKGKDAYEAEDFRSAWEHFRQAYLLSERPELLYNIGQAADRMHLRDQALTAFEMYLGKLPDADNAQEVRERIAALRGEVPEAPPEEVESDQRSEGDKTATEGDESAETTSIRTGMLFRAGAGLGLYLASWKAPANSSGSIRGLGLALDLVVAYPLSPGLLVGGAIVVNYQPAPGFRQSDYPAESMKGQTFWSVGPTFLYYLSPQHHGGFAEASLVLAGATKARKEGAVGTPAGVAKAVGGGFVLGGGYEIPFDGAFAYGVGGRVTLVSLSEADINYTALAITVTGSLTWY